MNTTFQGLRKNDLSAKELEIREQSRIDIDNASSGKKDEKKKSKLAINNYNENGLINTKPFNKSEESKGFWASFFTGILEILEEITGFGPGIGGRREAKTA